MINKNGSPANMAASEAIKWLIALLVSAILLLACAWLYAYDTDDSATISIIGGADGSTSVVISSAEGETYIGSAQGMFCEIVAEVTVNDGQIVGVKLTGADETPTLGGKVLEEMPAKILEAQSADVDGMTGATVTTNAVKQAVTQALEQAGLVVISETEVEATEAETEATEPETEATEPETEATEPETEATEPETEATEAEGETYTGSADGFGGKVSVTITVADGAITDVSITGDDETPTVGGAALDTLAQQIMEAQSAEIDGVSGATFTSNAAKAAASEALEQAGLLESGEAEGETYTGKAQGMLSEITAEVTVQDGKIIDVKLTGEETPELGGKVLEEMPAKIIEAQSTDVDGMTGATVTTNAVKTAVNEALEQAGLLESGEAEGETYTGKAQGMLSEITAEVTVQDGKIIDVKLTGEETPELGGKVLEEMPAKIIEAQSTDVDGMTGATVTTNAVKEAVNEALEQAGLNGQVYTGTAQGMLSEITAEVTVQDGKIVDVKLTGEETPELGGKVLEEMPAKIIEAQSADVDGMTGATVTTNAVKTAVNEALEQAGLNAD